jgi:hypothetical protein
MNFVLPGLASGKILCKQRHQSFVDLSNGFLIQNFGFTSDRAPQNYSRCPPEDKMLSGEVLSGGVFDSLLTHAFLA